MFKLICVIGVSVGGIINFVLCVVNDKLVFCNSSEISMIKKVILKNKFVWGILVIIGNIVRIIGMVLCKLIYEIKMCLCRLKLGKGSKLINIDSGWVNRIIYNERINVGMVIGNNLFGLSNNFNIRNMLIWLSYVNLLKVCKIFVWLWMGWLLSIRL